MLRDDGAAPRIIEALRRSKRPDVLIYEPDLSPAALMDAMAHDIRDPGLPEARRMQMLTELASLDYAYGRLEEASAKYEILYGSYRRHQSPLMQAFVLQGVGDVLRRVGRLPLARERYAQGLTLAITTQGLPLIMALAYAVGDVSLELQRFQDAADHLEIARKVALSLHNRPVEADALEKIGDARLALNRPGEAIGVWRDAAAVCRVAAYKERLLSVLARMAKTFGSARMQGEQRACENEMAVLRAGAGGSGIDGGESSVTAHGGGGQDHPKGLAPRERSAVLPATIVPPPVPPLISPTGNVAVDALAGLVNSAAAPWQNLPNETAVEKVATVVNGVLGVLNMDIAVDAFNMGIGALSSLIPWPSLPAAVLGMPHIGTPHTHPHPPSLVPPAPPIPLPSIGTVAVGGCVSVMIGGVPAARAGEPGPGGARGALGPPSSVPTGPPS